MSIAQNLQTTIESVLPRILTQACRDVGNPAYGCFDRNWWHYRIRDFASIILQQGGYTVLKASEVCDSALITKNFAKSIAGGSCRFWNTRACRHGAFEEYYPWEQGYPPLAFSTLAVAKLVAEGVVPETEAHAGLAIAARQLATRFEPKAANQQIAGLAALAWLKKVSPDLVSDEIFANQKRKSLALQTDEGWFWEYDGPDIGYLSVTIDCLWDLVDATNDTDFRRAADQALKFIFDVAALPRTGLGMLNARNTDYVVPYGIARYLADGTPGQQAQAASLLEILYADTDSPTHFFKAIDDRYWCHYIGHSVARAIAVLQDRPSPVAASAPVSDMSLPTSGFIIQKTPGGAILTLARNKGGCVRITHNGQSAFDFGWIVDTGRKQYVSHWWSLDWTASSASESNSHAWTVAGPLYAHKEASSTPWMHAALRIMSFCFGKSIIGLLKRIMIFKKGKSPYTLTRTIRTTPHGLVIEDTIKGLTGTEKLSPAPRASKRHVASADSFSTEDFVLLNGFQIKRSEHTSGNQFEAVTEICLANNRNPT